MSAKLKLLSIEKLPLIRKFTILFTVMSLLPFLVIAYLITQFKDLKTIDIDRKTLVDLLYISGICALAGYWSMRKSIIKIQKVTEKAKKTLSNMSGLDETVEGDESEVTQLVKAFNEVTKNLEDNIKRLEASKRTVQYVLSKIALGTSSLQSIDTFLELIVDITVNALDAKTGVLMLLGEKNEELYIKVSSGLEDKFRNLRIKVGEEGPGWVAKHKKPLLIPQLHRVKSEDKDDPFAPPLLCVPLIYQDKLVGVLAVRGKIVGDNFEEDELLIVSNLASQTAIAVENERLNQDAEKTYLETISALAIAVEARDTYSRGHLERVSRYAVKTAQKLGLDEAIIKDIKYAAELHDVGKIGIGDDILKKDGALNEEETKIMRRHVVIGEAIIKPVRRLFNLCEMIRHHHECIDGSGYPDGLKGDEISIGAKILSVVDTFDAMTTDRPYRKALTFDQAKEELRKNSGIRYDAQAAEAFLSV